jgi:predicted RNase H-like HicB family nuclease
LEEVETAMIGTSEFTPVLQQVGDCWIGWIKEIPGVNCQEDTRDELIETLMITLEEALEFNRQFGMETID